MAANGALAQARACTEALSSIVTSSGYPDALVALAYALAETAMAEGDSDAAVPQFARAVELHRSLEIPGRSVAAAVAEMGASLEHHLGRRAAAEHETAGLSRREMDVVRLLAEGLTNREIAARLVLSTRTIDMHVRNILAKLRSRTRTEAAARAADLGLLGDPTRTV